MAEAYVIGQITIKDTRKWDAYRNQVPDTLAPWGAEVVMRGRPVAMFSGDYPHTDIVVLRFRDVASACGWHASAAYQALIPLRKLAADVTLTCFEADGGLRYHMGLPDGAGT